MIDRFVSVSAYTTFAIIIIIIIIISILTHHHTQVVLSIESELVLSFLQDFSKYPSGFQVVQGVYLVYFLDFFETDK